MARYRKGQIVSTQFKGTTHETYYLILEQIGDGNRDYYTVWDIKGGIEKITSLIETEIHIERLIYDPQI